MNTKKILTVIFSAAILLATTTKIVVAGQYGQYGEIGEAKKISLDKKVKHPEQTTKGGEIVWVDNLFAADYKFKPLEEVEFKITIINTGEADLDNVKFKDVLPAYLDYVSGDHDVIFNLKQGESRDFYLKAKVKETEKLADGLSCVLNLAEAEFNGQQDQDTSQICIEKQVLGFVTLPEAGPAENLTILLGSTILGFTGLALVKKKA